MKRMLPNLSRNFWVKQLALVVLLVGASFTQVIAQTFEYRSIKDGNWNVAATWEKRAIGTSTWNSLGINEQPNAAAGSITITAGTIVTVTTTGVTADQLVVENAATLVINYPIGLTIEDGAGTDLLVNGTLIGKGRGSNGFSNFLPVGAAQIAFAANSVYKHEYQVSTTDPGKTAWGMLPIATWDPTSTLEINVAGAAMTSNSIPASANFDQIFGNVKWNTPALTADIHLGGFLADIQGNFEVISTGTTGRLVLNPGNLDTYALNVGQDLKILNNSKLIFGAQSAATGYFYLNIGKGMEVASTASFTHNRPANPVQVSFTGTNGLLNVGTALTNMNFEVTASANITLSGNFSFANNLDIFGTLNTGLYSVIGTLNSSSFNLYGGGYFGVGSPQGLNGNLNVPKNTTYLSPTSIFIFNGVGTQATGQAFPSSVGGLIINNPGNVVELTSSLIVTNLLSLQNGTLATLGKTLTLQESPSLTVLQNTVNNSFIDGTVRYEVATSGSKTLLFPMGKNNVSRPVTLTLTQGNGTNTYTASQVETALTVSPSRIPTGINSVSTKRHYVISQGGGATISNAFVALTYNADEVVANTEMQIIKSNNNGTWTNLGGALEANNTVKSTNPFTTFSQFIIAYKNNTPLPVELISFKAVYAENVVNVLWATASEKNNAYFTVERSADGKNFTAIGQVEGAGTTSASKNYTFADKNPLNNISYYRLKQVDLDGTFEYSGIVKVMVSNRVAGLSLNAFPNPTSDNVNVQVSGLNGAATVQVIDLTGRVITAQQIVSDATINLAAYPAGIYQIRLVSANGTTSLKVIKN